MSQCVPSWDIDDPPLNNPSNFPLHLFHPAGAPSDNPLELRTDYEVAELTWENGHLALHGLVPPRPGKPAPKATPPPAAAWNKQHHLAGGTLESVVNQATGSAAALTGAELEDWFGGLRRSAPALAVDALVPCQDEAADSRAGERDAAGWRRRERIVGVCSSQGSAAGSVAAGRVESTTLVTLGTCMEDDVGLTATATTATTATATATATNSVSRGMENSCLRKRKEIAVEDHVSISHACSESKEEKDNKTQAEKTSASAKKSRAAAVHNQSERKRRDRINQKMKTLQKLVPNSSKTDKASMLDEVIEYLKQLQAQVQMMRMNMNNMSVMMPMAMPQLQMPTMMAHLAQMPQMGMGIGMMDLASIGRSMPPTLPLLHPSAFLSLAAGAGAWDGASGSDRRPSSTVLPLDPFSALLACQMPQQPMSLDEYSRMATVLQRLYQQQQQQQQQQPPPPDSNS